MKSERGSKQKLKRVKGLGRKICTNGKYEAATFFICERMKYLKNGVFKGYIGFEYK